MCCKGSKAVNIAKGFSYLALGHNEQLSRERMRICRACDKFVGGLSCSVCGCFAQAKTRVESETCPHPDGPKWEPLNQ